MTNTIARIKKTGKNFEIIVDMDQALKFKKGETSSIDAEGDRIFSDSRKGFVPSDKDLKEAFGTTETNEIVEKIIKEGEILTSQEHRDAEQEKRFRQVVDFLAKNAVDPQTGNPHSAERIKSALEQARVNIKNVPVENQINDLIPKLSSIIPIKLSTKKIKVKVPAIYTGKAYGVISQYKESEKWLDDGSLEALLVVPSGIIMDFYDKLNSMTHGSALTEEVRE